MIRFAAELVFEATAIALFLAATLLWCDFLIGVIHG